MPKNVLHISRAGFIGGAERVLLTLAEGLPKHGYRVHLASPEGPLAAAARTRSASVHTSSLSRMQISARPKDILGYGPALVMGSREIFKLCRDQRPALLHAHHPVGALYAAPAAIRYSIPLVLHVHDGLPLKPLYALALRNALNIATRAIAVSGGAKEAIASLGAQWRCDVVHNGVDWDFLADPMPPTHALTGRGPHIGIFGTMAPRKGQDTCLEAMPLLTPHFPHAHIWLVGDAEAKEQSYLASLEAMAEKPALRGRVTFAGHQSDVRSWMRAMDVIVLPSRSHETLGMVLLEAMALGRPVIATRIGGIPEVLTDPKFGRLVPPADAPALAAGLLSILADRPGDKKSYERAARAFIERRFSPDVFSARIAAIYDEVLATRRTASTRW